MTGRTFAEFFAGIGLVRLGLEAAGWSAEFANDIDSKKHEMYGHHFGESAHYKVEDVYKLKASDVPDVALWWASFPCTDLSLAGYRRGLKGQESGSLYAFLKLLKDKDGQRPPLVALENVSGFLTSHGGMDFAGTIRALNRLGYSCDAFVLDAINFVPQSRPRVFIVGSFDTPSTKDVKAALEKRDARLKLSHLTTAMTGRKGLRWMIHDLPAPPEHTARLTNFLQRLDADSRRWWSRDRVEYLLGQMSPNHTEIAERLRHATSITKATVYRRIRYSKSMAEIRTDGVAGCLRTPKGGSSRQILLVLGKGEARARFMTPREYARLMGAPDYKIAVSDNQAYFGFGDAVCVPVISWIAEHALNPLMESASGDAVEVGSAAG